MTISGHKTRSVFDRYNIVSPEDLKEAARKQQTYLDSQNGYNLLTVGKNGLFGFTRQRGQSCNLLI